MTPAFPSAAFTEKLSALLKKGQEEARQRNAAVFVSVTLPVPRLDPLSFFSSARYRERVFWEQPDRAFAVVAVGAEAHLLGRGEERFAQVAAAWRQAVAHACIDADPACPLPSPVSVGGFSFDPVRPPDSAWEAYPEALLLIPRFLLISSCDACWFTVNSLISPQEETESLVTHIMNDLQRLWRNSSDVTQEEMYLKSSVLSSDTNHSGQWHEAVSAILGGIQTGTVEKTVLARQQLVRSSRPISATVVLRRLRAAYRGCTVFAFGRHASCFIGATPERLVRLDGQHVQVTALAGSAPRSSTETEDCAFGRALLADDKERREHALVVRALREALSPLCHHLTIPDAPTLLRMANVQHLYTPITGELQGTTNVLHLVEALHPTPACGGFPRESALSLIRLHESFNRGWYAGPIGWIDGQGSGEFVVAIRSALLSTHEAILYAGCGIVAGSDPEREYQESCLKLRPMLAALSGSNED